jgi:hypothetical protein
MQSLVLAFKQHYNFALVCVRKHINAEPSGWVELSHGPVTVVHKRPLRVTNK